MNAQLQTIPEPQTIPESQTEPIQPKPQFNIPRWNLAVRIAFRFWMAYLGLYCLSTQLITGLFWVPPADGLGWPVPDLATLWPLRPAISWIGAHIFHVNASLSVFFGGNSGTGDGKFGFVTAFCVLMTATAATVVWSLLDRRRENYAELHKWFRLFVRFALAGQLIFYGIDKVIPTQMAFPSLTRLLQPVGSLSPMGLLWTHMGSSPAYEIFTGCAELAGGLLLIIPRTATFGALLGLAAMIQVFTLNMTYDVPAKLLAFHTMLLAWFLVAPDVPRLVRFLLLRRTTSLSTEPQLFRGVRANRIALVAQIIFGLWLVGLDCHYAWGIWSTRGGGRPLPPLYGIWEVEKMSIDGQPRPPLVTDSTRWGRAVFDYPNQMVVQGTDESFAPYGVSVNLPEKTLALTKSDDKNWTANFTFQRPTEDQLILNGRMDNHQVHMELQLIDRNSFLLVSRGFHWINEAPLGAKPSRYALAHHDRAQP